MGELVEHVEHPILASIVGAVLDKVVGPDMIAAARCLGWIEGQLGKEPLAGSIARCNLPQLSNVCGTQWRVIIDPVEMCGDIRI